MKFSFLIGSPCDSNENDSLRNTEQMFKWILLPGIIQVEYRLCCYNKDTPKHNDINKKDVHISLSYQSTDRNFKKAEQLCAITL